MIGAAAGAVAGGYAGKGVGELIDPTTEDNWLRDNFSSRPYARPGHTFESFHPAYHYGAEAEARHQGRRFEDLEAELERDWHHAKDRAAMAWQDAREAVRDAYQPQRRDPQVPAASQVGLIEQSSTKGKATVSHIPSDR